MPRRPTWTPRNGAAAYGTPVSSGPKRIPGGYFKAYTAHKSEGDTKQPRKPRKTKPLDYSDEEAVRLASQASAARQYKAKRASVFSKAQPPSDKQRGYLRSLLGDCRNSELERFVEFANQLPSQSGVNMTRQHWVRAIDLALTGKNDLCTALDEIAVSFGYLDALDMETGQLQLNLPPLPKTP